jgi:transcriptional regulator with XRE-family HTH domain
MSHFAKVDSKILLALRTERGWTTRDLAERAGLQLTTVQRAERGERVKIETLSRLANALGVSADQIRRQGYEWDVFISHASDDKAEFVEKLARHLMRQGLEVWYDAATLQIGDNLDEAISEGIRMTEFGVVVLSPKYFEKEWTMKELEILLAERSGKILPIRFGISPEEVKARVPVLSQILSVPGSDSNVEDIVKRVVTAIGREYHAPPVVHQAPGPSWRGLELEWATIGKHVALFLFCALSCALASGVSAKTAAEGRDIVLSTGTSAGRWLATCGAGIGAVLLPCFSVKLLMEGVWEGGCGGFVATPFFGAFLGMAFFGLIGILFGVVLFLFDLSIVMNASTQVITASLLGATSGALYYAIIHVLTDF